MGKVSQDRPKWFRGFKGFLKIFVRKPKFVYLGKEEKSDEPAIILSNHVGAKAPVLYELYFNKPFRFWGTYEMNSGIREVYKYLSRIYLPQKKHIPKFLSKILAFIICPFVNLFYKGLRLISTYRTQKFRQTINESLTAIESNQNLIIFPEDSSDGYHDKLKSFFSGFVVLANALLKKGKDILIYNSYYRKKDRTFIISEPVRFSTLLGDCYDKESISKLMCEKTNNLVSYNCEKTSH